MKKFKSGDKVICKTNEYLNLREEQCVTVEKYIEDGIFYIEEEMGSYEDCDFVNVRIDER